MERFNEWYVLALANTGAELLHCNAKGFERVPLAAQVASPMTDGLHNVVSADVATDGGRYVPTSSGQQTGKQVPRATFANNGVENRGAFTEQYLTSLGRAVRSHVDTERTPLLVTMEPAHFALFQAVSGLSEVAQPLDVTPNMPSSSQLWELSRARIRDQATA